MLQSCEQNARPCIERAYIALHMEMKIIQVSALCSPGGSREGAGAGGMGQLGCPKAPSLLSQAPSRAGAATLGWRRLFGDTAAPVPSAWAAPLKAKPDHAHAEIRASCPDIPSGIFGCIIQLVSPSHTHPTHPRLFVPNNNKEGLFSLNKVLLIRETFLFVTCKTLEVLLTTHLTKTEKPQ